MIMPNTKGFIKDDTFYLRKTYLYDDSEDMEEFEGIVGDKDLSVTVEYSADHVEGPFTTFSPSRVEKVLVGQGLRRRSGRQRL